MANDWSDAYEPPPAPQPDVWGHLAPTISANEADDAEFHAAVAAIGAQAHANQLAIQHAQADVAELSRALRARQSLRRGRIHLWRQAAWYLIVVALALGLTGVFLTVESVGVAFIIAGIIFLILTITVVTATHWNR